MTLSIADGRRTAGKYTYEPSVFLDANQHIAMAWPWSYLSVVEQQDTRTMQYYANQILEWLETCIGTHEAAHCILPPNRLPEWVPTRLLEIDDDNYQQIRIVETNNQAVIYTAVSFCWGQDSIKTVTREKYDEIVKHGMPWEDLLRIHRDAIELTYRLGFRHIWIDAMCIIQQDKTDWEIESHRMAAVYENGILVLSAAHASNVNGSLLPSSREAVVMKNHHYDQSGGPEDFLAFRPNDHRPLTWQPPRCKSSWPAFARAWTLQERLLASRVVHFAPNELIWECSSGPSCECQEVRKKDSMKSLFNAIENIEAHPFESPEQRLEMALLIWRTVIMQASGRKLTRPSDRLVTNAGLARRFHNTMPCLGRYLAGVWEADIIHGLSWEVNTDDDAIRHATVAPSWSWASIEGEVWNESIVDEMVRRRYPTCLAATCEPQAKDTDPQAFGAIIAGQITLRTRVIDVLFDSGQPNPVRVNNLSCRSQFSFDSPGNGKTYEAIEGDVLKVAFMYSCNCWNARRATGLLLRQVGRSAQMPEGCLQFRRIGLVHLQPAALDTDAAMEAAMEDILEEIEALKEEIVEII
ncbi:hypothetical protein LTR10_013301 [Elasticomyces elasticus]|uniref:Heterokaryon incompatibility domain-containing protein n=1 Tax=Exophiala sideris TaxID=1016849 RepID=A0ABR0J4S1_9EURO|nr:hypothetical protein LTR10_013301 [Elasticomyces elasticus]KAK5027470.1 hypothetical protein LTS07_007072 [Exophiala sideris]KAK5034826.1 hypothetical protein LTR13_006008 [Exophiala sideris]KAK5056438.1 hypothetical protein LTR69_007979 [Exophiala sideris]KAK5181072.1 hypothetical protein LTR44_006403 [Eurotiomycetes sp. CCFEE 6388]